MLSHYRIIFSSPKLKRIHSPLMPNQRGMIKALKLFPKIEKKYASTVLYGYHKDLLDARNLCKTLLLIYF
jgi:hypothetical protein